MDKEIKVMLNLFTLLVVTTLLSMTVQGDETYPKNLEIITNNIHFQSKVNSNRNSYVTDILRAVFNGLPIKINSHPAPYIRAELMIEEDNSECFGLFPPIYPELIYSDRPWAAHAFDLYTLKENQIILRKTDSLQELHLLARENHWMVGVIAGVKYSGEADTFISSLESSKLIHKSYGSNALESSLKMLEKGRLDMVLSCPLWVRSIMGDTVGPMSDFHKSYTFKNTKLDLHFACKKSYPYAKKIIDKVNAEMNNLHSRGVLQNIQEKYNQNMW